MENFNTVPSTGKYGDSIAVVNENFMLAQQEMEMLRQIYNSMSQSQPIPVTTLPATGEAGKIYRLAGTNSYADYMYAESDLTAPIKMAEYDNAIDDRPTPDSNNLVKSGGVAASVVFDISAYHATGGTLATYADLAEALSGTNVPVGVRRGGMSVKFVQSSDNKYVQFRLISDDWSITPSDWQGVKDIVEDNDNLVTGKGIKASTIEETNEEAPVGESDRYYIIDKNRTVLGWIDATTGAKHWLKKNEEELHAADIIERVSSEIEVDGYDGYKFITDNNKFVIGYIDNEGGVYFYNLLNDKGKSDGVTSIMNTVANGGRTQKAINILNHLPKKRYTSVGYEYKTEPFISFHDDDTLDMQIPVSAYYNATPETRTQATNVGGFASFLFPFMRSITERHRLGKKLVPNATTHGYDLVDDTPNPINGKLVYGLAAEGQRIGLIGSFGSDGDSFDGELNLCGEIASKLHYKFGWDIMCHSMTARYIESSYWVDSINDSLVTSIEASATKNPPNNWRNAYIHCEDTGLDYEYRIDDNDNGEWHLVSDQYIRPYLAKTLASDAPLFFNPRYSEAYQVGEWKKRAQVAGLPFIDCGVSWGTSASKRNFLTRFEYIKDWVCAQQYNGINRAPLGRSTLDRITVFPEDNTNRWQDSKYNKLIRSVDTAIDTGSWLIFNGHAYENVERNYYLDGVDYGERRCDSYPSEWIVPLNQEELESIDENNYWDLPPARLEIDSWAEWYPCPGTTYDMLMNVIEYAIENGVEFGSTEEGLRRFANNFNIGVKMNDSTADKRLDDSEKNSLWNNYIIQGSDGSIEYNVI